MKALFPLRNLFLAAILSAALPVSAASSWEAERLFRELPPEARRLTGPLFWLHGDESPDKLRLYVGKVLEGGNGSFTPESRPHNDWLGPGWWRDMDICVEEARKNNLDLWIFDEKWWPSQTVANRVPPEYAARRLAGTVAEVEGPRLFEADGYQGARYIAAVAGCLDQDGRIQGDTLVDLASRVRNGKLSWKVPAGKWKVIKFSYEQAPGVIQGGGKNLSVDGASKDCVDWFLRTVYQPHFDRYRADFGKTIKGFFYDEPETQGDWGTELPRVLAEWNVDWKKAYTAHVSELAGEEQIAAQFQYRDALAEAWGRTMYGGISEWCRQRGVKSIGHFMEHSLLYQRLEYCAGDLMRVQGHSGMGGIDAVFDQFVMGKRVTRDAPCWQTPKLGSSISHAYGKPGDIAMVEIFGARGQDLTYPEMKWWADHMHVSGVNFLIPHSFNPKSPYDTDCPPYFYNSGFEPRWPLYRVFADYTSRLSVMLTGGRHVCPVAFLYLGQSANLGKRILPDQFSEILQDALYDCDWLPYEVFEKSTKIGRRELKLRKESYRVLVVPPVEVIPHATLARVKEFFDKGGIVLGYGFLPEKSATLGKGSKDTAALRTAIWGVEAKPGLTACKTNTTGGRSYFLPESPTPEQVQTVLAEAGERPTLEVLEGKTDHWLHVLHRVKDGRDVFFIVNQNHEGPAREFTFQMQAAGFPECWDAMRNLITTVPFTRTGKLVRMKLRMEPNESVLLVFQHDARQLPMRPEPVVLERGTVVSLRPEALPASEEPVLPRTIGVAGQLSSYAWVWSPEGDPARNAPIGKRYFRRSIVIPGSESITNAVFIGSADNHFELFINGQLAGQGDDSPEGWRNPVELSIAKFLLAGTNQLAILGENRPGVQVNPAGVIGMVRVEFASGKSLTQPVDCSWLCSETAPADWTQAAFDDTAWTPAREIVRFGKAPWKRLAENVTLSPVTANPYQGRCELGLSGLEKGRIYLHASGIAPELAARVTVNGQSSGGFIGQPALLDISSFLKPGPNVIRIEPFSPEKAELIIVRQPLSSQ